MPDQSPPARGDDFDATADETFGSAYPEMARLREERPLAWSNAFGGFWALTRHADIRAAASDTDRFITSKINVIPNMSLGERRPPLGKDPPEHTPYRRALDRTLRFDRLRTMEPALRAHAAREMGRIVAAGGGDVSADFATIFPAWVAVEWLNLDADTAPLLANVARLYNIAWRAADNDAVARTSRELYDVADAVVADRKLHPREPRSDPASALLAERVDGEPIPETYIIATIRQSLVVGLMAPPPLLGSISVHLSENPDLQDRLRRAPADIPAAVEEFLRLYTPYRGFARTTRCPVNLHGRTIEPDEPVTLVYSSANRDAAVFDDPDTFRMNRANIHEHLGFGAGSHRCAGMSLVRLELRIALEELLRHSSGFELAGTPEMTKLPELGPVETPIRFLP